MSLREEIANIPLALGLQIGKKTADAIINKVREYYGYKDSDITMLGSAHEADIRADERNKVLDAVIETVENFADK